MPEFTDLSVERLQSFTGTVPVLELENCVLLPESLISLRITRDADCLLIQDAIAADSFVAVSLKPSDYNNGRKQNETTARSAVCLAAIIAPCQLDSGGYSILLQGLSRATAVTLQKTDRPYHKAVLEVKPDFYVEQPVIHREHRQFELLQQYSNLFLERAEDPTFYHLLQREVALGKLCDILAGTMRLEPVLSQLILQEHDVDQRSDLVLSFLKAKLREQQRDPYAGALSLEFSQN